METTFKLFTNDLEDALKKIYKTKIDLINGKDKAAINTILTNYLNQHFKVNWNVKPEKQFFDFIGFEHESEAIWIYVQYPAPESPKFLEIENTLLYDYLSSQTNIVHVDVNGVKKSSKVSNPEKKLVFEF
ncbi:MAG: hypothetical protein K0S32_607 [Bacteroidetes bacterium]|nr:hypothetical protein [Bacteroidota bacterium]